MKLSTFIQDNIEPILQAWEDFARTLFPVVPKTSKRTLRDHAKKLLLVIAADLNQPQSSSEQIAKSKGLQRQDAENDTAAWDHGFSRLEDGFSINEMVSEYRALRASVTKLWEAEAVKIHASDMHGLIRFNEAIDQAVSESVASYALRKEQQARLFNTMLSVSPDPGYIIDRDGKFLYVNQAMCNLYQQASQALVGTFIYDLGQHALTAERSRIQCVLDTGQPCRGDKEVRTPSGQTYCFEYIYTPIFDEQGQIEAIVGASRDITERKMAEAAIWNSANYDVLTGLPNRRLFQDRLDQAMKHAKREDACFALLFIDLDHFKKINDELGHGAGDLLLKAAGHRIKACVRDVDTVARMGGDEFTVILMHVDVDADEVLHFERVAKKIMVELTKPFQIKQQWVNLSVSIGITRCPHDGGKSDTLLGKADRAMYAAKKAGRNQCRFYSSEPD